jgi:hypothetical protein
MHAVATDLSRDSGLGNTRNWAVRHWPGIERFCRHPAAETFHCPENRVNPRFQAYFPRPIGRLFARYSRSA